jgi:PST family polysaccharide transporter
MGTSGLQPGPGSAGALRRNVAALSAVQAANYLVPLVSVPYLVRVVGADRFGQIAFAQAFVQFFVVVTDFGFNYSATRAVSVARGEPGRIEHLFRSVTVSRLVLMSVGMLVLGLVVALVPRFRAEWALIATSYLAVLGSVLFPVWLFQGLEQMGRMAALSLTARILALLGLFVFVHRPSDYVIAAALLAGATPVAGLFALALLFRTLSLSVRWIPVREVRDTLFESWPFFLSTAAMTLYTSSNVFILGLIEAPAAVAYYAAADKVVRGSLGVLQPVTQALYPRMAFLFSRDEAGALGYLRRIAIPVIGLALLLSAGLYIGAAPAVEWLFGRNMLPTSSLLRIMSAVPVLVAGSNLLGVQLLFPLGYQALVSRFQVVAGVASIAALVPMVWAAGASGSALNYVASETVITIGFLIIALRVLRGRAGVHARVG